MKECKVCKKEVELLVKEKCKICYIKEYRKNNKEKIKIVAFKKYLRNREYNVGKTKEWRKNNPEKLKKQVLKDWYKNHELSKVRAKTKNNFRHLKKEGCCERCSSKEKLEFHHLKPLAYDNFALLCFKCHRTLHGLLLEDSLTKKVKNCTAFTVKEKKT